MTHFVKDYLLNVLIAMVLLSVGGFMLGQLEGVYYRFASLDNFYENKEFVAFDICEGDEHQSVLSERIVHKTKTGYSAVVNKELYQVGGSQNIKVYEEVSYPFVEISEEPIQRIQKVPTHLPAGEYKWILYVTLDIYGASREVIPPIESNVFSITNCNS